MMMKPRIARAASAILLLLVGMLSCSAFAPHRRHSFLASRMTTKTTSTSTRHLSPDDIIPFLSIENVPSELNDFIQTGENMERRVLEELVNVVDPINQKLENGFTDGLTTLLDNVQDITQTLETDVTQETTTVLIPLLQDATKNVQELIENFVSNHPSIQPFYTSLETMTNKVTNTLLAVLPTTTESLSPTLVILGSSILTYLLMSQIFAMVDDAGSNNSRPSQPYPLRTYDPDAARVYFDRKLGLVLRRAIQVMTTSATFGIHLLQDYVSNSMETNSKDRAIELAQVLTRLGPTFIKIGQSLSIRTDLLSPAYVRGLQTLQDQVPAFNSNVAYQMLQDEWGVSNVYEVVSKISPEPVAAASLGQVYKATLRNAEQTEVAIKVQRPNILEQIALDMHLLRETAPIVKALFNLNTDTVGTVDAWGTGFVDELDYLMEGRNAQIFMDSIKETPLGDVVFAPAVVEEYTTQRVLTTEWVEGGERLDKSSQEDVTVLCSIAMNTYLTMMLETGLLHCDPHPGNLLRTPDGKLCILDWGMVTRLDKELQLTLIEHMAHLTSADYEEIPKDLLLLGFIPPSKKDLIRDSGVVEVLADIYGAWTKGGGAATINVNRVISQLQDLTATRGNLFQIPPYFAYIAKSFSVLEGIGLSNDPMYSIINECLPYVSKRLLTDQSERTGGALSTFIFGPDKTDLEGRLVDYDRVEQLVTGFGNYTTSASGALLGVAPPTTTSSALPPPTANVENNGIAATSNNLSTKQILEGAADQILDLIFVEEETPLQTILLEQLAKIVSSTSRSVWTELRERSGTLPSGRTVLGTLVDPLGLWRTSPLVRMNELDNRTLDTTRKLVGLAQTQPLDFDLSNLSRQELVDLTTILIQKVWKRRLGVAKTGGRFARQLIQLTAHKLEKGDRTGITLPEPTTTTTTTTTPASQEQNNNLSSQQVRPSSSEPESPRLQLARRRLNEFEQGPMLAKNDD